MFSIYANERVLVTGHSGFKGGWLVGWLKKLGAKVAGASLPPDQGDDNLFERAKISDRCSENHFIDIRNEDQVNKLISVFRPTIIFHLAAQPLVKRSYAEPLLTFSTNILGAANVLESARKCASVKAVVFVTSDKVYKNKEWLWSYRENDELGGLDPYSASKGAAEIVAKSFMDVLPGVTAEGYLLATARGGNVIGGGDWSENRIIPDIVRALRANNPIVLRYPKAIRPWQHVLELCAGYLTLGVHLLKGNKDQSKPPSYFKGSFNFGPERFNEVAVIRLVEEALAVCGKQGHPVRIEKTDLHESTYLRLDSTKSREHLSWKPALSFDQTVSWTMRWYNNYIENPSSAPSLLDAQINDYTSIYSGAPL